MKCLQCGTELDRISKWRGASEYCSEDCKKKNQEELNELVMNRLMMPKPSRAAAVRTVDSGASRLTVVVHPVGASAPVLTEPPEAGFIMEDSAKLSDVRRPDQQPLLPNALLPMIPDVDLSMIDALVALAAAVSSRPPAPRPARELPPLGDGVIAIAAGLAPERPSPSMDPVWPESLGLDLRVIGIESFTRRPEEAFVTSAPRPTPALAVVAPPAEPAPRRATHQSIPARRPVRPLEPDFPFELGADRLLPAPAPAAPRLRIHLPKPTFHALCPRFTFAPPPEPELASAVRSASGAAAETYDDGSYELEIIMGDSEPVRAPKAVAVLEPAESAEAIEAVAVEAESVPSAEAPQPAEVAEAPEAEPAVEAIPVPTFGFEEEKPGLWQRIRQWKKAGSALVVLGIVLGASGDPDVPALPGNDGLAPKVNSLRGSHE